MKLETENFKEILCFGFSDQYFLFNFIFLSYGNKIKNNTRVNLIWETLFINEFNLLRHSQKAKRTSL